MAGVEAVSGAAQQPAASERRSFKTEDFFQLLLAQLRQQDPLEPVKNTEFIGHLAQLNALEQLKNLNGYFEQLLVMQQTEGYRNELGFAAGLLGRLVEAKNPDTGNVIEGMVLGFYRKDGVIWLQLEQMAFPLGWVEKVAVAPEGDSR